MTGKDLMKPIVLVLSLILPLGRYLFGQAVPAVTQTQTFHISGVIKDPSEAVIREAQVSFQSERLTKAVITGDRGGYEADLPLGDYTMAAQSPGFRPYRRPLFRVTAPASLTFDITLPIAPTCDVIIVGPSSPQDWANAQDERCLREDFFQLSSVDGVPYQIYIRYVKHAVVGDQYTYTSEKYPNDDPVFVAYNLFSLQAERVIFDKKSQTIEARGNVIVANGPGNSQHADYVSLRLEDGRAVQK
jgi:hypothetical protein